MREALNGPNPLGGPIRDPRCQSDGTPGAKHSSPRFRRGGQRLRSAQYQPSGLSLELSFVAFTLVTAFQQLVSFREAADEKCSRKTFIVALKTSTITLFGTDGPLCPASENEKVAVGNQMASSRPFALFVTHGVSSGHR
jgi:hypothetical protein